MPRNDPVPFSPVPLFTLISPIYAAARAFRTTEAG